MSATVSFRVRAPFLAVTDARGKQKLVEIPTGAVIESEEEQLGPGLIEIRFLGEHLSAFKRDISERAEPLPPTNLQRCY